MDKPKVRHASRSTDGGINTESKRVGRTEFERLESRRRVNEVADEPPTLTRLPRKALETGVQDRMPVSGVQKRLMDEERERAIQRYRQLKRLRAPPPVSLHHVA